MCVRSTWKRYEKLARFRKLVSRTKLQDNDDNIPRVGQVNFLYAHVYMCVYVRALSRKQKRREKNGANYSDNILFSNTMKLARLRFSKRASQKNLLPSILRSPCPATPSCPMTMILAIPCIRVYVAGRMMRSNVMRCNDGGGAEENSHNQQWCTITIERATLVTIASRFFAGSRAMHSRGT